MRPSTEEGRTKLRLAKKRTAINESLGIPLERLTHYNEGQLNSILYIIKRMEKDGANG